MVAAHLTQAPTPLAVLRASVPPALAALVMRCLEKRPADRWQSAGELLHALESFSTPVDGVAAASATRRAPIRAEQARAAPAGRAAGAGCRARRRWRPAGSSSGLARAAPLDADLIAVAPFDVPDSRLSLWREGLVDVLSRNLDGAGPVRSVPSTTVIRRWSGRADRPSAAALGRRTGARLVVFGSLIGAGPDSARLTATAFDVVEDRPLADIELRDAADRMDRLADSLTVRLLRELGRTRRIEVFRTTSLGSTSLPALKAFLRGEQWFRRASWDSALVAYEQAIALDSTFPLALWRSSMVLGWQRSSYDSVSLARALPGGRVEPRAGPAGQPPAHRRLGPGRAVRHGAARGAGGAAADPRAGAGAHPAISRRHESWYVLGEARYHWGSPVGSSPREALEAFDRAIRQRLLLRPGLHPRGRAGALARWTRGGTSVRHADTWRCSPPMHRPRASGWRTSSCGPGGRARRKPRVSCGEASPHRLHDAWLALVAGAGLDRNGRGGEPSAGRRSGATHLARPGGAPS